MYALLRETKTFQVNKTLIADGNGLYGLEKGTEIKVGEIEVEITDDDKHDCHWGFVNINHAVLPSVRDEFGFEELVLPYTDKGIRDQVIKIIESISELSGVISDIGWSELGMQGENRMNFDAMLVGKEVILE